MRPMRPEVCCAICAAVSARLARGVSWMLIRPLFMPPPPPPPVLTIIASTFGFWLITSATRST